jgi:hypothetical protein
MLCSLTDGVSEISEETSVSETLVLLYQNTKCHISECCNHDTVMCISVYGRGFDWWMDLLDSYKL